MSGILSKKERFFDTVVTEYGRELLSKNIYDAKYATVSDSSIIYEKDFEASESLPVSISNSEYFYLPMESDTTLNNLVDDFEFNRNYTKAYDIDLDVNSDISDENVISYLKSNFTSEKIKNKNFISDKNFSSNKELFFKTLHYSENSFNFNSLNSSLRYNTVHKDTAVLEQLPIILNDKRFYHKTNNKILEPINDSGTVINTTQYTLNTEEKIDIDSTSEIYSFLKAYDVNFSLNNNSNRESTISQIINHMEKNENIIRKTYKLKDITENDNFIFEIFEVDFNAGKMEKLVLIDLGKVYDNENGISKDVYLVGKILNSRNKTNINNEASGENISYAYREKNNFYLSSLYSYINMFVLIAE